MDKIDLTGRDSGLDTLWSSSGPGLWQAWRRLEMSCSSDGLDSFKVKSSRGSELEFMKKRRDQRELIKVAQRNFRKYLSMRDWGWFIIIQKTRGMIGQPDPEGELRLLEEKANETYGNYKDSLDITGDLKSKMGEMKDDIKALSTQLESEQGNVSVYTDRQAKALTLKAEAECELAQQMDVLKFEEDSRLEMASEVK